MRTCLWSDLEQTIKLSMCKSAIPVLVGWLLVHVLCPGLLALVSKKVFMTRRLCVR